MKKLIILMLLSAVMITGCKGSDVKESELTTENVSSMVAGSTESREVAQISTDFPYYENCEDFLNASKLVVVGHVLEINNEILEVSAGRSFPYHILTVAIDNVIKGDTQNTIKIKVLGGEKDGAEYIASGLCDIKINDTCFFGLDFDTNSEYMWPVNYKQGVQVIDNNMTEIVIGNDKLNILNKK